MAQMIIVEPFALGFGGAAPSFTVSRGAGAANLIEPDPREIWQDAGYAGTYEILIDLGAVTSWDYIALVNVTAASAATWTISGGATYGQEQYLAPTAMRLPSEDGNISSGPARYWSSLGHVSRYIRITVIPGAAPANNIGCLVVGKSWMPSMPREQGAGRTPIDTGVRTRLDNGGLATVSGKLLSGFKWIFGDLDPPDLKRLWGIFRRRRTSEPMVLDEDPDEAVAEALHYGTFVDLEAYERRDASKSRWALSFEDWV
jgi:hypothetical protein